MRKKTLRNDGLRPLSESKTLLSDIPLSVSISLSLNWIMSVVSASLDLGGFSCVRIFILRTPTRAVGKQKPLLHG